MKWQSRFFNFAVACVSLFAVTAFTACDNGGDPDTSADEGLKFEVNRTSIVAGESSARFTVMKDGAIVTHLAVIKNLTDNTEVTNGIWTSATKGTYTFEATFEGKKAVNTVEVKVCAPSDKFFQSVLLTKFTATWCGPCGESQPALDKFVAANPDQLNIYAVHAQDIFSCSDGDKLAQSMNVTAFPTWYFNMDSYVLGRVLSSTLARKMKIVLDSYTPVCGIKATSSLVGNGAKISVTVKFQEAGNYKISGVLTEDGLYCADGSVKNKIYDHVLRGFLTEVNGNTMPAVTAGEERTFEYEAGFKSSWVADNLSFVIYVSKTNGDSQTYVVNNSATCPVNGSVAYKHAPLVE